MYLCYCCFSSQVLHAPAIHLPLAQSTDNAHVAVSVILLTQAAVEKLVRIDRHAACAERAITHQQSYCWC